MSQTPEPPIRIRVDPTNPGQFFACCGLLELADRLWGGAEGWFVRKGAEFCMRPVHGTQDATAETLMANIASSQLTNIMTPADLQRRDGLSAISRKERETTPRLEAEKKGLDKLWREVPLHLHAPFGLRLDWFADQRAGGGDLKTWAGQQSVFEIARGMKAPIEAGHWSNTRPEDWLLQPTRGDSLPFYFDSDFGGMGSDLDVGFSFDPLKSVGLSVQTRPLIEFAAFVGLQRFRPTRIVGENRYRFAVWSEPLDPQVAPVAASSLFTSRGDRTFEFRLLYRTDYLKSFLPAQPVGGGQ